MAAELWTGLFALAATAFVAPKLLARLRLAQAKHPSISGHARISRRLAPFVPFYEYSPENAFASDDAPPDIIERRRESFQRLGARLAADAPQSIKLSGCVESRLADLQFTNAYRVPFQFRSLVSHTLKVSAIATATEGVRIRNLDGNWSYDLGGSYGVNLLGYDFYKACIDRGVDRARSLGPVLGPYHPLVAENAEMLSRISGLDQVSFHMSGTEAVMQAVTLARYHTQRSHLVMFCGAYHGWWDGVQPGPGGRRKADDVYLLQEDSKHTLKVLETRDDIACVLVNPLQALHPNRSATNDAMLLASDRRANFDREAHGSWLRRLSGVCRQRGIVLIFDEVFVGFRLGTGGAQAFFEVKADMVTYGKTVGGGLPVGVLCGRDDLMKRFRDAAPTDIYFARGTFNAHPYVMATMNEFLQFATSPEFALQIGAAASTWDQRAKRLNSMYAANDIPLKVHNVSSVWILTYTAPGRYNWLYQYYLRANGLTLSWVGTGRFIFSHDYTDADFDEVATRCLQAAIEMREDGWWDRAPHLTDKAIKRRVFKELLQHRLNFPKFHAERAASDRSTRL